MRARIPYSMMWWPLLVSSALSLGMYVYAKIGNELRPSNYVFVGMLIVGIVVSGIMLLKGKRQFAVPVWVVVSFLAICAFFYMVRWSLSPSWGDAILVTLFLGVMFLVITVVVTRLEKRPTDLVR